MNPQTAVQSLGFSLPSPAYLFAALVFGLIGFAAYRYGRKADRPVTKWLGVALMFYPYAITTTWLVYAVGMALCVGVWMDSR